jgi:hypothetical protein
MRRVGAAAVRDAALDHSGALLFVAAYAIMTFAWIFANPPFAAPDEWAHVVRAESIAYGQLIGTPPKGRVLGPAPPGVAAASHKQEERWAKENTRRVSIPAGKTPQWFSCSADPLVPAICLTGGPKPAPAASYQIPTGNYQPFPYLLPALVARLPVSPNRIAVGMRAVKALLALALIAAAFFLLWTPEERSLPAVGLLVTMTPMVVFLAATVNPSGLEIAAAIAFFAALLRVRRARAPHPAVWAALGASGVVLSLSRGQAPVWVVLDIAVFLALVGVGPALALVRSGGRWAMSALGAIGAAMIVNRVWETRYGPHLPADPTPVGLALKSGWFELPGVLRQEIGSFDYLENGLSPLAYIAWYSLVAALVAIALLVGTRRERAVLCTVLAASLVIPVALVAVIMRHTGYGLQGRYVLAFSVVVPLLAGEIVFRGRAVLATLNARGLAIPFAAVAAAVHLDGLYANARRFAVGVAGPQWFPGKTVVWAPPGGWWPWLLAMVTGAALLAFAVPLDALLTRRTARRLHGTAAASGIPR